MIDKPFIPAWNELRAFAPELWLIAAIVAVLLTPFFARRSNIVCALVALLGMGAALIAAIVVGVDETSYGPHFRGLMVADQMSALWKVMLLIFSMGIVLMWFSTTAATMHEGDGPEFFTLLLGATLGMSLMAGTSNLLMVFMCVELASLPSYVLAGFRKTHKVGAEASLKYVLFGAVTSSVMVYGLSYLYGLYGTLQADELASRIIAGGTPSAALLSVAVFGLIIGLGFKISAVPFHFWCPDVFEGASIDVSAFLSVASKGAGLILMLRLLLVIAAGMGYRSTGGVSLGAIAAVVGVLGAITATVGNTAAFVQDNIKRLLAYSSISHAGYMLCALSLIVKHDSSTAFLAEGATQAILLYMAVYMFMNLGAFTVAGLIYREAGSENINDYEGMFRRNPILAACMTTFMFSLVGLPPFAGFVAKLNVMYVLGANGGWWWALVAVIGLNTVFSLYYYMRVIRVMYLKSSDKPSLSPNPLGMAIAVMCAVMLVVMFAGYGPLNRLTATFGKMQSAAGGQTRLTSAVEK
ncbi:MAG TPA: NADH-quinone oxidoreductase subunit N [Tepidisphaeraceae bacterium]|nr:NADH-quinone oxidoreductase subunit N [Tepidisphaeraceae bacterium]